MKIGKPTMRRGSSTLVGLGHEVHGGRFLVDLLQGAVQLALVSTHALPTHPKVLTHVPHDVRRHGLLVVRDKLTLLATIAIHID